MISFIDAHRAEHGVEPICRTLKIAPSTYYEHDARRKRPEIAPLRVQRDEVLKPEIRRVYDQNFQVYGQRKIWKQLKRKGFDIARCTVARLMKNLGLKGFIRGKPHRTTVSDKSAPCPLDRVNRCFKAPAPNILWVADFTYVAMAWVTQNEGRSGVMDLDRAALGIPELDAMVERYCAATNRDGVPDMNWYFAYNFFRLAGIIQGIKKRVIDGTASSSHAQAMAERVFPLAESAWKFAEKAGA